MESCRMWWHARWLRLGTNAPGNLTSPRTTDRTTSSSSRSSRAGEWMDERCGTAAVVHWAVIRRLVAGSLLGVAVLAGCHLSRNGDSTESSVQDFKVYKLRGKVVSTDAA